MDTDIYGIGLALVFLRPVLERFLRKYKRRRITIGIAVQIRVVVK